MSKMNHSQSTNYCLIAESVLAARGFSYLLLLEIVVGSLATLANAPLMIMVWRVSVFHYNLRLLLSQLSFALLWYSIGYVIKAVSLLNSILQDGEPCDFTMSAYDCKRQEMPYVIPISITMYTLLFVNLERLYSTLLYRKYERGRNVPWFGFLTAAIAWICPIALSLSALAQTPRNRLVGVCENLLSITPKNAKSIFVNNIGLLTAGVVCCVTGYMWNKYRSRQSAINRAKHNLAARFQIDQNVKVNRVMMPSMFFVTLCYLPNYVFLLIVIAGLNLDYETQTWLIHVNYLWKLIYALAHALISFKRNTYLRQRMGKVDPAWVNAKVKTCQGNEHQVHFNILEQAWQLQGIKAGLVNETKVDNDVRRVKKAKAKAKVRQLPPLTIQVRRFSRITRSDADVSTWSTTTKF